MQSYSQFDCIFYCQFCYCFHVSERRFGIRRKTREALNYGQPRNFDLKQHDVFLGS